MSTHIIYISSLTKILFISLLLTLYHQPASASIMPPKAKKTPASLVPIRPVTRGLTNVTKSKKFLENEKNFLDPPKLKSRKLKQFKK